MSYVAADYFSLVPEGTNKWELLKGLFKMSPAPKDRHQKISAELFGCVWSFFRRKKCQVREAPYDVVLGESVVQPDICVICDVEKIHEHGCVGIPDFIVEILSKTTEKLDRREKFDLYEEFGLKEYWMVDTDKNFVEKWILKNGELEFKKRYEETEKITSEIFPQLEIDLTEVF